MLINPKKKYLRNLWNILNYCEVTKTNHLGTIEMMNPNLDVFDKYDMVHFPLVRITFMEQQKLNSQCISVTSRVHTDRDPRKDYEDISLFKISVAGQRRLNEYNDLSAIDNYITARRDILKTKAFYDGKLEGFKPTITNSFDLFFFMFTKIMKLFLTYPEIKFSIANSKYFLRFNVYFPFETESPRSSDLMFCITLATDHVEITDKRNSSSYTLYRDGVLPRDFDEKFNEFERVFYKLNGLYFKD